MLLANCGDGWMAYISKMTEARTDDFRLMMLRHAHAAWASPGMRDFDRPLDARGREEAQHLAEIIVVNGYLPHLVVCSPAARCTQTLDIILPSFPTPPVVTYSNKLFSGDYEAYLETIAEEGPNAGGALMIIGHNPMIEETAHALLMHDRDALNGALRTGFPTAGLLVVDSSGADKPATSGYGRFVGLLSPVDA